MKISQRSKQLQELTESQNSQGLSLSSLLGRILIYSGVLVNLILPFYDFKSNGFPSWIETNRKSWKAEARQNVSALNRAQQAYFLEKNAFADSIDKLGVEFIKNNDNYSYRILAPMEPVQSLDKPVKSAPNLSAFAIAQSKNPKYSSYIGAVYIQKVTTAGMADTMTSIEICEIDNSVSVPFNLPTLRNKVIQCPPGSKNLGPIQIW